jgi:hypothetical protein
MSSGGSVTIPATSWLATVVLGTLAAMALLTAVPASLGARQPAAPVLQSGAA